MRGALARGHVTSYLWQSGFPGRIILGVRRLLSILAILAALAATSVTARSGSRSARSSSHSTAARGGSSTRRSHKCISCARDSRGRIKRNPKAVQSFRRKNPCPATGKTRGACPGYQVDHRSPLSKGGADDPSNMQWLTTQQHKEKTAREEK